MYWAPVLSSSDRPTFLSPFRTFQPSVPYVPYQNSFSRFHIYLIGLTVATGTLHGIARYFITVSTTPAPSLHIWLGIMIGFGSAILYFSPLWETSYTLVGQTVGALRLKLVGYVHILEKKIGQPPVALKKIAHQPPGMERLL